MLEAVNQKLEKELKKSQNAKVFSDYLKGKCKEDSELAQNVLKKDKTLSGLIDFIKGKAKAKAARGFAMIEDVMVFKWVEEYYGMKDIKVSKEAINSAQEAVGKGATTVFSEKKKKKSQEMKGQIDMFSLMGGTE